MRNCVLLLLSIFVCCCYARTTGGVEDLNNPNSVRNFYQRVDEEIENLRDSCSECMTVAAEFKSLIDDRSKMERLKIALKFLCDYMGGERAQECKGIVDNLEVIIHQLQPYLDDPHTFCKEIHLCGSEVENDRISSIILVKLAKIAVKISQRANSSANNDMLCDECVFAASEMSNLLKNQQIQQQLKAELESICGILSSYEQRCNQAVEEYFPKLLMYMQNMLKDPQQLCSKVGMCRNSMVDEVVIETPSLDRLNSLNDVSRVLQTSNSNSVPCVFCISSIDAMKTALEMRREFFARKFSNSICGLLPKSEQCSDFTSIYGPTMLTMSLDQFTPDQLCKRVKLCTDMAVENFNSLDTVDRASTICEACHALSDFLSYELRQQPLQHEITSAVKEYFCKRLPGDLENQCLDTADQYIPNVLSRIADQLSSASFCLETGLCTAE